MSAPADEMTREVARVLALATDESSVRSVASLQEEFAIGHGEMIEILGVLNEHGMAIEETPGDWRGPMPDEIPTPEDAPQVRVSVAEGDNGEPEGAGAAAAALRRRDGGAGMAMLGDGPTVRLTRAIVDALDAAAVGQIVQAALAQSEGVFLLEVTP